MLCHLGREKVCPFLLFPCFILGFHRFFSKCFKDTFESLCFAEFVLFEVYGSSSLVVLFDASSLSSADEVFLICILGKGVGFAVSISFLAMALVCAQLPDHQSSPYPVSWTGMLFNRKCRGVLFSCLVVASVSLKVLL